jgi:hypothetical protein
MPLRAIINSKDIYSYELTDTEWQNLQKASKEKSVEVKLPCCNQIGYLRKSSNNVQHFVHLKKDKTCDWKPESPEHLYAKLEVIKACEANGWKAIPEYSETSWRADVLAIKDNMRIAFEIQWSNQTKEKTEFRQENYTKSGVRCCWFFKTVPTQFRNGSSEDKAFEEIPFFKIEKGDISNIEVVFSEKRFSLRSFVEKLLTRKFKFCKNYSGINQDLIVYVFDYICWNCGKAQKQYYCSRSITSKCEKQVMVYKGIDKHPNVVKEVLRIANENELRIGEVKNRFSKSNTNQYFTHGCYSCDAIFGNEHLQRERFKAQQENNYQTLCISVDLEGKFEEGSHWCYSENNKFCD